MVALTLPARIHKIQLQSVAVWVIVPHRQMTTNRQTAVTAATVGRTRTARMSLQWMSPQLQQLQTPLYL
jgi:hypothetical protein